MDKENKEAREKLVAKRKLEKLADVEYKKKIAAKIAADKEARKRKAEGLPLAEEKAAPAASAAQSPTAAKKAHTRCVLIEDTRRRKRKN